MKLFTELSKNERIEIFRETAARRGMSEAVVEKDYWVCFVLERLFSDEALSQSLLFKGGTSLSKVFGLIERFSEDIDLIVDWRKVTEEDPLAKRSKSQQEQFNRKLQELGQVYVRDVILPQLQNVLKDVVDVSISEDPNVVDVAFPASFLEQYIRPLVKLEIGPLAIWVPNAEFEISAYVNEEFPKLFRNKTFSVRAIRAERTFWEKVTILHHEAGRPMNSHQPLRYSRHYYDLFCLSNSGVKQKALSDLELLKSVVYSKEQFYPRGWARYDLAKPGTMRLVPSEHHMKSLKEDYKEMRVMIFGDLPDFDEIMTRIEALQMEINKL
jgi:hypothetical protein